MTRDKKEMADFYLIVETVFQLSLRCTPSHSNIQGRQGLR